MKLRASFDKKLWPEGMDSSKIHTSASPFHASNQKIFNDFHPDSASNQHLCRQERAVRRARLCSEGTKTRRISMRALARSGTLRMPKDMPRTRLDFGAAVPLILSIEPCLAPSKGSN